MTHFDLRKKYLNYWKEKPRSSVEIPSSSLVPENDPTTLFTGSGMQPMIPYLLGAKHPLGTRIVDIQKIFRGHGVSSDDTLEVGDNRHQTFFEHLGNWSLGDYFKREQLSWYFEFLTKVLGLNKNRLYVSCFEGSPESPRDEETAKIWKSLGIAENHVYYYGVKKNWWSRSGTPEQMPIGEIGGPDSETFYEFTNIKHDPKFGERCHPNCDCGRFLEIGNSVFITYQKQSDGSFKELAQKNVDFGGGLERTLMAVDDTPDTYKTDLFTKIIKSIENVSGKKYGDKFDREFRIISDHIKAATFLISDHVFPSNKDRGYVLRRLIRRSIRFGRYLDIKNNFTEHIAKAVLETYREPYPELIQKQKTIFEVLTGEENKFQRTVENGLKELEKVSKKGSISAQDAFYLYESFGFPFEMTEEEAKNKNLSVASKSDFDEEVKKHQESSRSASKGMFKGGLADHSEIVTKYHTATHLLHAALRKILGEHVHQEGSNLTAERLRFDFSYPKKLGQEEIKKVEDLVNEQIKNGLEQKMEIMPYDEAIKSGALAFFKERYPEKVSVYNFGSFSREICGGPHIKNTKELKEFKIIKEESVSSGIRRIYGQII